MDFKRWSALLKTGVPRNGHEISILGCNPFLIFQSKGRRLRVLAGNRVLEQDADPFHALQAILDHYRCLINRFPDKSEEGPIGAFSKRILIRGGGIGAFSYDLNRLIESIPERLPDLHHLPDIIFTLFSQFMILNENSGECLKVELDVDLLGVDSGTLLEVPSYESDLSDSNKSGTLTAWESNFNRNDYIQAVKRVKEYIGEGDIYQVNISQQFKAPFTGDAFRIFERLNLLNPAPMSAYMDFGGIKLISSSPERFLMRQGNLVESRPIKGTMLRGRTAGEDRNFREMLLSSAKEEAELSMIVDLMRNDIGKLARSGSVKVAQHKVIEEYSNVFQMLSIINADVSSELPSLELIRSCFPGGSVTGCPKLQAMKIIEELERDRRGFYCGSMGYIDFDGNFDLNIAIRTITVKNGCLFFNLGGGIVFDSDPESEYEETLHKGKTIFESLRFNN
ncbi:MAG: aminodeoxychorismate synthase component I [Acidobacteriota bacterium]